VKYYALDVEHFSRMFHATGLEVTNGVQRLFLALLWEDLVPTGKAESVSMLTYYDQSYILFPVAVSNACIYGLIYMACKSVRVKEFTDKVRIMSV
jgi:hypothetical protein